MFGPGSYQLPPARARIPMASISKRRTSPRRISAGTGQGDAFAVAISQTPGGWLGHGTPGGGCKGNTLAVDLESAACMTTALMLKSPVTLSSQKWHTFHTDVEGTAWTTCRSACVCALTPPTCSSARSRWMGNQPSGGIQEQHSDFHVLPPLGFCWWVKIKQTGAMG